MILLKIKKVPIPAAAAITMIIQRLELPLVLFREKDISGTKTLNDANNATSLECEVILVMT